MCYGMKAGFDLEIVDGEPYIVDCGPDRSFPRRLARLVPVGVATYAAGPDEYLRHYLMPCYDCGEATEVGVDYGVPGCCEKCSDAFWCPDCGGHPDDCDC